MFIICSVGYNSFLYGPYVFLVIKNQHFIRPVHSAEDLTVNLSEKVACAQFTQWKYWKHIPIDFNPFHFVFLMKTTTTLECLALPLCTSVLIYKLSNH